MMPKILLVDDDTNFRRLIKDFLCLSLTSLCVKEAGDGEEALEKIEACPPDIIFMDIRLPGENGLVLTQKIKKKYPAVEIDILTSYYFPILKMLQPKMGQSIFF